MAKAYTITPVTIIVVANGFDAVEDADNVRREIETIISQFSDWRVDSVHGPKINIDKDTKTPIGTRYFINLEKESA